MRRDLEARLYDRVAGEAREGGYPGLSAQSRYAKGTQGRKMMSFNEGDRLCGNRYELESLLGTGTYGSVWVAQDTRLENRKVAIKALHTSGGRIRDLEAEATTQARLNHQNIATIHDVDIDDRVIVMEYIRGQSLERFLKDSIASSDWPEISNSRQILAQCFDALIYAHSRNVVHGDVKPGNILLHDDGTVRLTDFGVAKVISESDPGGYPPGVHRRLGSIAYMAPEVISGSPRDFRSDIFSMGIVTYLLFTGIHPFYSTDPSGLFSVRDLLTSDFQPSSPKNENGEISDSYDKAIMRMLAKDPEDRFQSMKEAYEELIEVGIVCPACAHGNPEESSYCNQCGSSLKEVIASQFIGKSSRELQERAFELNSVMRYSEAIRFCDESIELDPKNSYAYHTKAWALSSLRSYDEALENYKKALLFSENDNQRARIHTNISYVYWKTGDPGLWQHHLEEALRCDPYFSKAYDLLHRQTDEDWNSA